MNIPLSGSDLVLKAILVAAPDMRVQMLTRLAFAAAERPRGPSARRLRSLLRQHLAQIVDAALAVAQQSGPPMTQMLAKALTHARDIVVARHIVSEIGEGRGHMAPVEIACRRLLVAHALSRGVAADPEGALADVAALVSQLHDVGRLGAAIAMLHRTLAAFQRDGLAKPLVLMCQLGALLTVTGHYRRAEILLMRALSSAEQAGVLPVHMADDWMNLATARRHLQDMQGALTANQRAIEMLESTAADSPQKAEEWEPMLATALSNHAHMLQDAGRLEAAKAAILKAVEINERYVARDPDLHAPRLVETLINASSIETALGNPAAGRVWSGRAVAEAERLPSATRGAHGSILVSAMINHAIDLERQGENEHAMEMAGAAVAQAETLYREFGARLLQELVDAHTTVCNMGLQGGYLMEARQAGERAMVLLTGLPLDALGFSALYVLPNLSDVYAHSAAERKAFGAGRKAYDLLREAETGEGASLVEMNLRIGVRNIYAKRLMERGSSAKAVAILREAVALADTQVNAETSSTLSHAMIHLANALSDRGDTQGALDIATKAVALREGLARLDPVWAEEELPTALYTQARLFWQIGKLDEATAVLDRAVKLSRLRLERDRHSALSDLASALEFSAVIANQRGQIEKASAQITEALTYYEELKADNADCSVTDLANALHHAAMIAMTRDDLDEAILCQQQAVSWLEQMPEMNAGTRKLLADTVVNLGIYYAMGARVNEGLAAVTRVPQILGDLTIDWLPAQQTLVGAEVARSRLLIMAGCHAEAAECVEAALAGMVAVDDMFWRGPALVNHAMALAALGDGNANAVAQEALLVHLQRLNEGDADSLHGYCDAAAVQIDLGAKAGTLIQEQVQALLAPLPSWFARLGTQHGGVGAMELVRAINEHCGGLGVWPAIFCPQD